MKLRIQNFEDLIEPPNFYNCWEGRYTFFYYVQKKSWLWGWEDYDNLTFKKYDDALKHLSTIFELEQKRKGRTTVNSL